jgi:hypothetical protein
LTLLLAACRPIPPTSTSPREQAPMVLDQIEIEPEPVEPEPVEPQATTQRWQFTTLVTGAAPTHDALIGANGFYELEIDGETATIRKIGQTGTPQLPADKQLTGTGTLREANNAEWPSAQRWTLEVELANDNTARRVLVFDLWFFADELHGTWAAPNEHDDSRVGSTWGLVQGLQRSGDPLELTRGDDAACMVCVRAFWNCDGSSFEEPACNSADSARTDCDERLEQARTRGDELPRGCGDFMS